MLAAEDRRPMAGGSPERRLDIYFEEIKRKIEVYNQEYIFRLPDGSFRLPLLLEKPLNI
jgi:hypothetical protein